jgi:hypothetical protein
MKYKILIEKKEAFSKWVVKESKKDPTIFTNIKDTVQEIIDHLLK